MKISNNALAGIVFLFAILTMFHYYYAHLIKDMLVPELGIAVFGLFILGILLVTGKLKVK
jgi:hypothetical protein